VGPRANRRLDGALGGSASPSSRRAVSGGSCDDARKMRDMRRADCRGRPGRA
jgi:hypothetical protein